MTRVARLLQNAGRTNLSESQMPSVQMRQYEEIIQGLNANLVTDVRGDFRRSRVRGSVTRDPVVDRVINGAASHLANYPEGGISPQSSQLFSTVSRTRLVYSLPVVFV